MRFSVLSLASAFVLLWSSGWIGLKFGLGYSGPFTFLAIRYVLVVAILVTLVVCLCSEWKMTRADATTHVCIGFLSHGVFLAAGVAAMSFGVTAGATAFVTAMQPVLTSLFAAFSTGISQNERPGLFQWMGAVFGIFAVYLAVAPDLSVEGSWLGYSLLYISVTGITIATLIDRRATLTRRSKNLPSIPLLQIMLIHTAVGLLLFSVLAFTFEGFEVNWSLEYSLTIVYLAFTLSIGSYGLLYVLLRRMSAVKVSSLIYLTPPVTMLLAWPILDETVDKNGMLGLLVGSCAVLLVLRGAADSQVLPNRGEETKRYLPANKPKQSNLS